MLVGCLAIAGAGVPAGDRPERLLLEGRHPRPGPVVPARTTPLHGWLFCVAGRRGGHHGVLHVPPVVHDVRRRAARPARLRARPRVAAGRCTCRWWSWPCFAVGVGWNCAGHRARPGAAAGAGPAGGHRPRASAGGLIAAGDASRRSTSSRTSTTIHVPATLVAPSARRWPGFLLATVFYGLRDARSRRRPAAVRPDLPVPREQVVVRRAVRRPVRAAGAVRLAAGWPRSTSRGIDWLADGAGPAGAPRRPAGRLDRPHVRRRPGEPARPLDLRRGPAAPRRADRATCGNT